MKNKVIITDNGDYLVSEVINYENNTYGFVTNVKNYNDSFFALMGETEMAKVEDSDLIDKLLNVIASGV